MAWKCYNKRKKDGLLRRTEHRGCVNMNKSYQEPNLTMLTDFYELTMANGYFANGYQDTICYFDMFFRKVPDNGGFAIMALSLIHI